MKKRVITAVLAILFMAAAVMAANPTKALACTMPTETETPAETETSMIDFLYSIKDFGVYVDTDVFSTDFYCCSDPALCHKTEIVLCANKSYKLKIVDVNREYCSVELSDGRDAFWVPSRYVYDMGNTVYSIYMTSGMDYYGGCEGSQKLGMISFGASNEGMPGCEVIVLGNSGTSGYMAVYTNNHIYRIMESDLVSDGCGKCGGRTFSIQACLDNLFDNYQCYLDLHGDSASIHIWRAW